MKLCISIDGDDEEALVSLQRWLASDPELSRSSTFRLVPAETSPEEMGGLFDLISAVVSDGTALGSLIMAYLSWRDSRPHPPAVRIERDGVVVNLADYSPEMMSEVLEALTKDAGA